MYKGLTAYNFVVVVIITVFCFLSFQEGIDGYKGPTAHKCCYYYYDCTFFRRALMGTKDHITLLLLLL